MKIKKTLFLLIIFLFLYEINPSSLYAQDVGEEVLGRHHWSLKDLDISNVAIECFVPPDFSYGITTEMLEAFLETEMKKRGIKIAYKGFWSGSGMYGKYPYFRIRLTDHVILQNTIILDFELLDEISLVRNPKNKFYGIIWKGGGTYPVREEGTRHVLYMVQRHIDIFLRDYKKSNPED